AARPDVRLVRDPLPLPGAVVGIRRNARKKGLTSPFGGRYLASGKYWRVGDVVHIQEGKEGTATDDYLVKGGEIRQVGRSEWAGGRPQYHKVLRRPATDFLSICDIWREMMIDLVGPEGGQVSFDRWLELSREVAATTR